MKKREFRKALNLAYEEIRRSARDAEASRGDYFDRDPHYAQDMAEVDAQVNAYYDAADILRRHFPEELGG